MQLMQDSQFHRFWLLGMSQTMASRSVRIDGAGLDKVRQQMAKLEKPLNPDKRGWSQKDLAEQAYVGISTVKRFLEGTPRDRGPVISILKALKFDDPINFIAEHDSNLQNSERDPQQNIAIDWQRVCQSMLHEQQEEQRFRRRATEMGFEVNVFVPLGLIERKQQQRRSGNVPMELVHQLEQEVITRIYEHDEFMTDVIGQNPSGKNKHIAIVGEPGSGKTTLLDKIATHIQQNNQDLPICITLASLQGKMLKDYILQEWLPEAISLVYPDIDVEKSHETSLQKRLRQGGVWLLLDGVDEIGEISPAQFEKIRTQLTDWLGKVRVVLTCRTNVWDAHLNNPLIGFDTYKTQEFKSEQVDNFIQQWFAEAKNIQRGQELQKKLQEPQKERIRQLVTNPLRLSLLCQIFNKNKQAELPETKAELYQHFVRYFYEWKPAQSGIDWATQPGLQEELHQALGRLSIAGLDSDARFRLPLSLIQKEMSDKLFKLAWNLGWLNLVDREATTDEPVYAFFHPTFQEYFAAWAIDDWYSFLNHVPHNPEEGVYRIFEPHWIEVILFWLGFPETKVQSIRKNEFIDTMLNFEDSCGNFYKYRSDFLTARLIAEFRNCNRSNEILSWLVESGFGYFRKEDNNWQSYDGWTSEAARQAILETNSSLAVFALVNLIYKYPSKDICQLAAWALGKIALRNTQAVKALVSLIYTSVPDALLYQCDSAHYQAIQSLGEIGFNNPEAINVLLNLIDTKTDNSTRVRAAESLGRVSSEHLTKSVTTLLELMEPNEDACIRCRAAYSLWYINFEYLEKSVETLVEIIQSSPDEFICLYAVDYLRRIIPNHIEVIKRTIPKQFISTSPEEIIEALNLVCDIYDDADRIQRFTMFLEKIDVFNPRIINRIVYLMLCNYSYLTRHYLSEILIKNIHNTQLNIAVSLLKDCLTDEIRRNDFDLYYFCSRILWHCAQNMSYPEFYRAWHR
ncbi:MAG TPA: hypothetical protein DCY88_23230 [Cyanobacteria bacterium UBA11372]|nr:hypothetical protein [Cyanobacteria bacterium UBA11372]